MRVSEFILAMNDVIEDAEKSGTDPEVVVRVYHRPTLGGASYDPIKSVAAGFDWDKGKVFIYPTEPPEDERKAMRDAVAATRKARSK